MSKKKKEIDLEELFNKEFYIVDCANFIFFPRVVRAVGFEMSTDELIIITDIKDCLVKENRRFSVEYLEQYKNFDEAKKEAERLNNLPKYKELADNWNSPETIFRRKLLEESIGRTEKLV